MFTRQRHGLAEKLNCSHALGTSTSTPALRLTRRGARITNGTIRMNGLKRLPARSYRSNSGNEPVWEWLKGLDAEDRRIIGEDIKDGRVFVANWYAASATSWPGAMGNPKQVAAWPDSPSNFLC